MINKTLEERLEELTLRLVELTIQQDSVNNSVLQTRREVEIINTAIRTRTRETVAAPVRSERVAAVIGSGYYIGDRVTILNPVQGQETHGVVIGETKDRLLKVKPLSGKYIKRLPKNVRRDERS